MSDHQCRRCGLPIRRGEEFYPSNPPRHVDPEQCEARLKAEVEALKTELGNRVAYCGMVVSERDDLRAEVEALRAIFQRMADNCPDCKGSWAYIDSEGLWEQCEGCAEARAALAAGRVE